MNHEGVLQPRIWKDLPGPRRWPLVGNALQMKQRRLHLDLEAWAREHGRAYAIRIGSRECMVVSDPETIGRVLRDRPDTFRRSKRVEEASRQMGFLGLFSANGETWKRQRPMVLGSFDPSHIRDFFPTLVIVTERLARRWQSAAVAGAAIELQGDLMRYTVDVTAALAFGEDINTLEAPQDQLIQSHLNHVLPALERRIFSPFPALLRLNVRRQRELHGHLKAIRLSIQTFIARTREKLQADPRLRDSPENLIQAMVARRDKDAGLTDEDVSGNVLTMLLAGEDTTANTLAWLIWLLSRNPESLRRATQEAREVLAGTICAKGTEQLGRMDFIEACAHEAMRLKPVAPVIGAEALHDTLVEDVLVKKGQLVLCLMRMGGMEERRFCDPQAFRPERWLLGEGAAAESLASVKRVVMPFGAGPRMCPGRYLALAEIKMAASMLLANFELGSVATRTGGEPEENIALTMYPAALEMRLRQAGSP